MTTLYDLVSHAFKKNLQFADRDVTYIEDNHPILFELIKRIISHPQAEYDYNKVIPIYEEAYDKLLRADAFDLFSKYCTKHNHKILQEFLGKVKGPCLVDKEYLEDSISLTYKKKEYVDYKIDYHQVMNAITVAYDFNERGFFPNQYTLCDMFLRDSGLLTEEELKIANKISPFLDVNAAMLSLLIDFHQSVYLDYWHYLLDCDFGEISNGSMQYLGSPDSSESEEQDISEIIFNAIREITFKEVRQLTEIPEYNHLDFSNGIKFWVEW